MQHDVAAFEAHVRALGCHQNVLLGRRRDALGGAADGNGLVRRQPCRIGLALAADLAACRMQADARFLVGLVLAVGLAVGEQADALAQRVQAVALRGKVEICARRQTAIAARDQHGAGRRGGGDAGRAG
ncbi:hypothetical protein D3C81_1726360 [compost metagenome]